jgi:hypothetical protein
LKPGSQWSCGIRVLPEPDSLPFYGAVEPLRSMDVSAVTLKSVTYITDKPAPNRKLRFIRAVEGDP